VFKLYASVPLVRDALSFGLEQQYLSRRLTVSGATVDGCYVTNLSLLAPRLYRGLEASVGVYNVFDSRYFDPGGEEHVQDALVQYGRTLRFLVRYAF
jgi:iron complex outermembrane receptor protein